jgi:hypothetical protein
MRGRDIQEEDEEPIPRRFVSVEEIQDFRDAYSTDDCRDEMGEIHVEFSAALQSKLESPKFRSLVGPS